MPAVAISVEGIGKRYRLGRPQQQYGRLTESLTSAARSLVRRGQPRDDRGPRGRRARHRRPQRRGQVDAPQDPVADHRADDRPRDAPRPRRVAPRGRHRVPPGAERPRERLPVRGDPRHAPQRYRPALRRDRGVRGRDRVPRHAGQALLERHEGPARVRRRRLPRAGDPRRRRGALGRRRGVPAQVPRPHGRRRPRGPDRAVREPQHARRRDAVPVGADARRRPDHGLRPAARRHRALPREGDLDRSRLDRGAAGPGRQRARQDPRHRVIGPDRRLVTAPLPLPCRSGRAPHRGRDRGLRAQR